MSSLNKVMLIGNLGKDPEIRYTQNGTAVANFTMATTDRWTDGTGERQEKTEWHRVVFRDRGNYRLGQIAGEYLKKGSKVYVEGRLQTRKWQDKAGVDHYTTEIIAEQMQMLDSRSAGSEGEYSAPSEAPRSAPRAASQAPAPAASSQPNDFGDFDDDIPF